MRIRPVEEDELDRLREIELEAGVAFATIGMTSVADADPPPVEHLDHYRRAGRCWVQADSTEGVGLPVAYLIADVVDGNGHVEQVSVHPSVGGRGLGRQLIDHAAAWARGAGLTRLTLTTFVEVPWNGPYYERLGFRVLDDAELGPDLRRIRDAEAAAGLDRWPRCAMVRDLGAAGVVGLS
jgi:GNAT superfamily N-acetyltransferase